MKKIILFCYPTHPNLGDQAQLMCTEKWIKENYPTYKYIKLKSFFSPFCNGKSGFINLRAILTVLYLKLFVGKDDVFIGHSGYFFVDHHSGWFTYDFIIKHFSNKFIILPQTINFYTPVVKNRFINDFNNRKNLILLCRDEVSYNNAEQFIPNTKHFMYPDIVTSLIGTRLYHCKRDGVLFCMRNDIEAFYKPCDIELLFEKFGDIRKEIVDTTLKISESEMKHHRDELINNMIKLFSTYKVVITDRYHGTIFSAIANTPVVVINSADHKLSSGVNWFPKEVFGKAVRFANDLDEAYVMAKEILESDEEYSNPAFFKKCYWDKLKCLLDK